MAKWSDRTTYHGKAVNRGTKYLLTAANTLLSSNRYGGEKEDVTMMQGGYNKGGVSASAGTHDGGGAFDLTPYNWKNRVKVLRLLGVAYSNRPALRGVWGHHGHGIVDGDGTASAGAKRQVTAYHNGRNGLANNGKDADWRPLVFPLFVFPEKAVGKPGVKYLTKDYTSREQPTTKAKSLGAIKKGAKFTVVATVNVNGTYWDVNTEGKFLPQSVLSRTKPTASKPSTPKPVVTESTKVRVGTLNFPDRTKITVASEADRIKAAVRQIKASDLAIVALQEGVGSSPDGPDVDKDRDPSSLMQRLRDGLGGDWDIVEPTTAYNENYFLRRKGLTNYRQHPDAIIRGSYGGKALPGRHVTLVEFTTDAGVIVFGNTQLVNDNRPGAAAQATLAAGVLREVAKENRFVLLGDFNTSPPTLQHLVSAGLKDARVAALESSSRSAVTYTNQTKTKPSTNPDWLIDGIWVSKDITVNGYTVVLDTDSKGNFILPRSSDHALVIVSLS